MCSAPTRPTTTPSGRIARSHSSRPKRETQPLDRPTRRSNATICLAASSTNTDRQRERVLKPLTLHALSARVSAARMPDARRCALPTTSFTGWPPPHVEDVEVNHPPIVGSEVRPPRRCGRDDRGRSCVHENDSYYPSCHFERGRGADEALRNDAGRRLPVRRSRGGRHGLPRTERRR